MFGGIAVAGADRILFAQHDGDVFTLDIDERTIVDWLTPHPFCPEKIEVGACAMGPDGSVLLADVLHRRVRHLDATGRPIRLFGIPPVTGLRHPDQPGELDEPTALLVQDDDLLIVSAGEDQEFAVQRFGWNGEPRGVLEHPTGGYFRAHGIARVDDEIWVTETDGGTIRRFSVEYGYVGDVKLHFELQRPFRLAADGYGGAFLLLAPESEAEQDASGVARIAQDGTFEGWVVAGGEEAGQVHIPFDIAVLADGRFVVADLPMGGPPDVRLQLFTADGPARPGPGCGGTGRAALPGCDGRRHGRSPPARRFGRFVPAHRQAAHGGRDRVRRSDSRGRLGTRFPGAYRGMPP